MGRKCTECGSTDIEVDTTRADAVCTNCGAVLESSIIVSDIQFEENAHGGSSAIGTFVSNESKGGKMMGIGGNNFVSSIGRESREITLKNARKKIVALATQLRLRPDHIDMAFYFFKLALSKHLTRGRKSTHVIAACVYITCRTEGTSHMLIDFSDILQICVYELGRTYLRLSQALCINIPAMDPCLYVMRFAHRLEFGEKTHDVSMTALRLVSRMKKDWIHFGRRPSGLCGAALLIAARLHDYSRSITDVIKVVKVHESTLRKRLSEFGETPASQLTLDEFMTVDLDAMTEEQDPPSFKVARKKDRERLALLEQEEELEKEMSKLEELIEKELEERKGKMRGPYAKFSNQSYSSDESSLDSPSSTVSDTASEKEETEDIQEEDATVSKFLSEDALGIINNCLDTKDGKKELTSKEQLDYLLMPPPSSTPVRGPNSPSRNSIVSPGMGLRESVEDYLTTSPKDGCDQKEQEESKEDEELDLTGIDEDEIDSYIMSNQEIKLKTKLWLKLNADYLLEQEEKIKREAIEREELIKQGKDPDKKKRVVKRKARMNHANNGSAIEAIEKIVQEKKISTKINYDVLRSLNDVGGSPLSSDTERDNFAEDKSNIELKEESQPKSKRVKMEEHDGIKPLETSATTTKPVITKPPRAIPMIARGRSKAKPNLVPVKTEARRAVNLSAFISKPSKDNTEDKNDVKDVDNSRVDLKEVVNSEPVLNKEKSEIDDANTQDSGFGSQGVTSSSSTLSLPLHSLQDTDRDTYEDTGGDTEAELGVAELLNRHMGQTEPSYSDVEDDYY